VVLHLPPSLDHLGLDIAGFRQIGGLVSPSDFTSMIGDLFPIALWGHIKANCIVGDAIELGQSTYKEWCGGDSKAHKASLDVLAKLGAVRVTWGKKGLATGKATLVKRLL
jgi:hypothetical protein